MLLTLTTTHSPATELGYLLGKHPERVQSFELSFGQAHVFFPEASAERCTAALLLDVDPVGLVRGRGGPSGDGQQLEQYVNDRPYVASSFLSVALAQVFRTALQGRCRERPELAELPIPLEACLSMLPCRGGQAFLRSLFEPLGYEVEAVSHALDEEFPDWGPSPYYTVTLRATMRLGDLLSHLYVLIPVLDREKHYWIGQDEVEKLLRHGSGWLEKHPAKSQIVQRYLRRRQSLVREALRRLAVDEEDDERDGRDAEAEAQLERSLSLHEQRLNTVVDVLKETSARRILDLGCGTGRLLSLLIKEPTFTEIVGVDVSYRTLEVAHDKLHLDRLPERQRQRIRLQHGALTYRDRRLEGFDAAAVVEVIEHLDPPRLAAFERILFQFTRPRCVIITTPNREYNAKWETLPAGQFRHGDHRFEWTRVEFANWAEAVAARYEYAVRIAPIGPEDPELGAPTQMAVFSQN